MKYINNTYILFSLIIACGDPTNEDLASGETGELGQELSANFDAINSYGVSSDPRRKSCTKAAGGGSGFKCRLPANKAITYNYVGSDFYECPGANCDSQLSWKSEFSRAKFNVGSIFNNGGNAWTFTQVALQPATITITPGTCSGNATTSNNIQTFVCTDWGGADTQVTESLPGNYYRWSTGMVIKVDTAKIAARAMIPSTSEFWATCTNSSSFAVNYHQILEHGMHAAVMQACGIGADTSTTDFWWNRSTMERVDDFGQGCYDMHEIFSADSCRARSYVNTNPTVFGVTNPLAPLCQ